MRHNRDALWKSLLPWIFDDLLRFVFPGADEIFDLDRELTFLDKELTAIETEPGGPVDVRLMDSLVKVFRKNGKEEWVFVHLEIQDYTKPKDRPAFPERMFRYFYRCFDKHRKPITAISIFCGSDGRLMGNCFKYDFMGTNLSYAYNVIRILDYKDEDLISNPNPFAWIVLAAKYALLGGRDLDQKLLKGKLFIFRKLYENGLFNKEKLQAVFRFLNNYLKFEDPKTELFFNRVVDETTHKTNGMDIFELCDALDLERKEYYIVKRLLTKTTHSIEEIAFLADVKLEFVKEVQEDVEKEKKRIEEEGEDEPIDIEEIRRAVFGTDSSKAPDSSGTL